MARSWWDYNKDPLGSARPTVTRFRRKPPSGVMTGGVGSAPRPWRYPETEEYEQGWTSPYEILDMLRERFNRLPVTYSVGPDGKRIATKTMPGVEMPSEMARYPQFAKYFGKDLTTKWVLPKAEGEAMLAYNPPASDAMRQGAYNVGVSNVGSMATRVNPSRYWPSSSFNAPMRGASGMPGAMPTPVFGGTIDYSTGRWHNQPGFGTHATPYGRFNAGRKTVPMLPAEVRPRSWQRRRAKYRLDQRKQYGNEVM